MSSAPEPGPLWQEVQDLRQRAAELEHVSADSQALRESEMRLQQFFAAAFEGIVIHDRGKILDANDALAAMLGMSRKELIGQHVLNLVATESQDTILQLLARPNGERHEVVGVRKHGTHFPVAFRAKDFPLHGRTVRVAVVHDLTEERRAQEQLRAHAAQLETLSRRLFDVQEQERRHLARELHDEIGQMLTGLKLTLEMAGRQPDDQLRGHVAQAQAVVRDLTAHIREMSLQLRPSMLDDLGLVPTILWHVERFAAATHIHLVVQHRGVERRFPAEIETAAYRIVQEALTNIARHAQVTEGIVRLWFDEHVLTVQVEDRGRGFLPTPAATRAGTSGLSGMRERILLLGGHFSVYSQPGSGTTITAQLPVLAVTPEAEIRKPNGA